MSLLDAPIPTIPDLQQHAAKLLQESLAQASQTANPAQLSAVDLELARSNIKALAFVQAVGLHGAYRYLRDFIARQAIPIYSAGAFLDGWLATYGLPRKDAAAALGSISGTGVTGSLLPADTLVQTSDGRQYRVTADVAVAAGVFSANVVAVIAGLAGDVPAGTALTLVSPVTGVDSACSTALGLSGGADVETDAQAIYRLQQRLANEPLGGAPADYARWALTVPSITRAWGVRNPYGPCTAGVIIMADGNAPSGVATPVQQGLVRDYIRDPKRGPPDELFVIVPTPILVNVALSVQPDTAAIRTGVEAALKDLFFREAAPGQSLPLSHITEVVSAVTGEYNHTITTPTIVSGGVLTVSGFDQLLVLGSVTFTAA
jgi:uncharacterized phage protein gp47/JayE